MKKAKLLFIILLSLSAGVVTPISITETPEEKILDFMEKGYEMRLNYIEFAPEKYQNNLRVIAFKYGTPNKLLFCLPHIESTWKERARSHRNCVGLGQINVKHLPWLLEKFWHHKVEFDIYNGYHNLNLSFHYLSWLRGQTDSWKEALIAYNWGLTNLNKYKRGEVKSLPEETSDYIKKFERLGVDFNELS